MSTNTTPRTTATVTINSVTNFNQELATYNATVSWGGASTTVTFEWSRDNSSWDATTSKAGTAVGSPVTTNSASAYFNATGFLSDGQPYYVRAKAVNAAGTVYSSSTSFTPWTLKTQGPSNTNGSRTIDTVTPTGGSAQPVYIYQIAVVGGGGGAGWAGGGGGGALNSHASALVTDGSRIVSWTIGGGGAAGFTLNSSPVTRGGTGGTTSITGTNTTISATGGTGAISSSPSTGTRAGDGGSSGNSNAGGEGRYDLSGKSAIYAGGGGGGNGGAGGSHSGGGGVYIGGAAGASTTVNGLTGGGGGSGSGSSGQGSSHASDMHGKGGDGGDPNALLYPGGANGNSGAIIFKYYGP